MLRLWIIRKPPDNRVSKVASGYAVRETRSVTIDCASCAHRIGEPRIVAHTVAARDKRSPELFDDLVPNAIQPIATSPGPAENLETAARACGPMT